MTARPLAALLATALAAPLLGSCSGGGLGDDFSVEEALEELPAVTGDARTVRVGDVDRAADLVDAERDSPEFGAQIALDPLALPLPPLFVERSDTDFQVGDVASFAAVQAGSERIEVFRVTDGEPPDRAPSEALQVATEGDEAAFATDVALLEEWRDPDDTLADDDELGPLAEAIDGGAGDGLYGAVLFDGFPEDARVTGVGFGQADDDGDPLEVAVFAVAEGEDVGDLAEQIEDAWRSSAAVEDGRIEVDDVSTDGDVVVVRLLPDEAGAGYEAYFRDFAVDIPR